MILQNSFEFSKILDNIQFLGKPMNSSKKVWIEYESLDGKIFKLTINLKNSFVKATLKNGTKTISGKLKLKKRFVPGNLVNVTFGSTNRINFTIFINGEKLDYVYSGFLISLRYGGDWRLFNATTYGHKNYDPFNKTYSTDKFFVDFSKNVVPNISTNCNTKFTTTFKPETSLNYSYYDLPPIYYAKEYSNFTINNTILGPNEMIEYEIRETLCPNSATKKIKIASFSNSTNQYYIIDPGHFNYDAKQCPFLLINIDSSIEFRCQNSTTSSNSYTSMGKGDLNNPKYLIQGPIRKYQC
uniref:Uncharacterized protein n=1 Tax=Panagrolaimus davidi TaxID=227884 RepID=A0A914PWK9_9BILA